MFSRVLFLAVLSLFFVGALTAPPTYTFCYKISGAPRLTLDDPYSIAVLVTGDYNTTLQTSTASASTPAGQYYNLLSGTGTRKMRTRYNVTQTFNITSLLSTNSIFGNTNRFYVSNSSFPQFVDANGLAFNLSSRSLFPGKVTAISWGLFRNNISGPVLESGTGGQDLTKFNLTASIVGWTGDRYVPGTCEPAPLELGASPSIAYINGTDFIYTIDLNYNMSSKPGETVWNVQGSVSLRARGVSGPDANGDEWIELLSYLPVNGTRRYCFNGTCATSVIYGVLPLKNSHICR